MLGLSPHAKVEQRSSREEKEVPGGKGGPQAQRAARRWMRWGPRESMGFGDLEVTAIMQEHDGGGDQTGAGRASREREAMSKSISVHKETAAQADQRFCAE